MSEEATRLLDQMKADWEAENREDEEREIYEEVHKLVKHPWGDEGEDAHYNKQAGAPRGDHQCD